MPLKKYRKPAKTHTRLYVVTRVHPRHGGYEVEFQYGGITIHVHGGHGRSDTVYAMKPVRYNREQDRTLVPSQRQALQYVAIEAVLGALGNKAKPTYLVDADGDVQARVEGGISRRGRGGAAGTLHTIKAREVQQMTYMLKVAGYTNPALSARKLAREGIGPEELRGRIQQGRGGVGSLEHSHGFRDASRRRPPPLPSKDVRAMTAMLKASGYPRPTTSAQALAARGVGPAELAWRLEKEPGVGRSKTRARKAKRRRR